MDKYWQNSCILSTAKQLYCPYLRLPLKKRTIMKKIVLVLVVVLSALAASAQKSASATTKAVETGRTTGTFLLALPADVTSAQVDKVKGYYKEYFAVNYNETKHEATIVLTKNEQMNRRVIIRFLGALGVQAVTVDGKEKTLEEFYEGSLK
jgi:hypothetical protein